MKEKHYKERQQRYWMAKDAGYTPKEAMRLRAYTKDVVEIMCKYKKSEKMIFEEALENAINEKGRKKKRN